MSVVCECGARVRQPRHPLHVAGERHRAYAAAIGRNGSSPQPNVQVAVVESSLDAAMMVLGWMGHEPLGIGLEALCELFDRFFAELGIGDAP